MVIQNNIPGLNSSRIYKRNNSGLVKSLEKLSSGYAINRDADNSAGLAVSEKMRSQLNGIKQSSRNCRDGISLIQTFEGALGETVTIIKRMKTLAIQAANGTYDDEVDRAAIQIEYGQLCDEMDHIADTDFNGIIMLNGRKMADKFTFLTEDGIKWLTPSKAELPQDSFVSTFKEVEGFPEISMSIELLPDAKEQLVSDEKLMHAFEKLNNASIKAFYDHGVPAFTLEGLSDEDKSLFSIQTDGYQAVISTFTSQSGKVDIVKVNCTELPHYASTSATGVWINRSVATYSGSLNPNPKADTPGNNQYDVTKFTESYVNQGNSAGVTKAERQAYLDWINDTPQSKATLIADNDFNEDSELKFIWSLNGQEYQNSIGINGLTTSDSGIDLPVYADGYTGGPQIYIEDFRFLFDDEDMKAGAYWGLYTTTRYSSLSGYYNGKYIYCGTENMENSRYHEIWLENGRQTVTLTYNKADGKWYDNFGGSGDNNTYGIDPDYYPYTDYYVNNGYVDRNLCEFYEADGTPPDGLKLTINVNCPNYRAASQNGFVFNENAVHNDKSYYYSDYSIVDFKMDEYDPAHPELGGVDYMVAQHGATYTYDGRTQPNGSIGVWRNEDGNAVNLSDEGIYLPQHPDSREILSLHDGMTITVNNPTMVGEDYIKADIRLFDEDRSVNYYRRIYDNITYSESLTLQAGARTKDSVDFTFAYSSDGLGGLEADLNCTAKGLGIDKLSLAAQAEANFAIDKLDNALCKVSMIRSSFGAAQNRLEHKIDNLNNTEENLTAAESRIRDTDVAREMMIFTKNQILTQASQAMLAQANSLPQQTIGLLNP